VYLILKASVPLDLKGLPVQPRHVSLNDLKLSRVYCVLKAYFDESYDGSTMCVGGWLCTEDGWKLIEDKWLARIAHENRMSVKKGHPPITRYHATYCANLKKEFSATNGWSVERQIQLTKKLIGIVGNADPQPIGIVIGLSLNELRLVRPDFTDKELKWWAYRFCMGDCLNNIGKAVHEWFTHDTVTVIHDGDGGDLDVAALEAYQDVKRSRRSYAHQFVAMTPGEWRNYPALQPADMLAYEGFKFTAARKRGSQTLRKSLEGFIGHDVIIRAGYFNCQ